MSIILNKYRNSVEYVWYDSSNIECSRYLNLGEYGVLDITFKKNGQTYRYNDVKVEDYVFFRDSPSIGKAFKSIILDKYTAEKITINEDMVLSRVHENEKLKTKFIGTNKDEYKSYSIKVDYAKKEFVLLNGEEVLYYGKINEISIFNLLRSMDIPFEEEESEDLSVYYPKL